MKIELKYLEYWCKQYEKKTGKPVSLDDLPIVIILDDIMGVFNEFKYKIDTIIDYHNELVSALYKNGTLEHNENTCEICNHNQGTH